MHWQRLSTQQTVGLFSRETDTAVYILHRCFLCPEGPRGGGQPNTNMVSFSHGGLTLFERVIWSHLLFISTMWLFVLGCLCHACFLLCGTSEDDNGSSLSGVSSFQELFVLSDQRFKLCIVCCDRRVSVSVCVCVWQAAMMFSSGVFWTGLVFIPITSLVFDVAYKVWVFPALSSLIITPIHGPEIPPESLISPERIPEF